ncbi:MAG: hypothetical protein JW883_00725 [Deltaproteobacteria bacterium]|nr:hypothetical protein [Deltaproteobacteria bacterium]
MKERDVEKQFKILEQEIALNGEQLEALRRDQRAATDAMRLEVETLRRCLVRLFPDSDECFATVRAEVAKEVDPEAL